MKMKAPRTCWILLVVVALVLPAPGALSFDYHLDRYSQEHRERKELQARAMMLLEQRRFAEIDKTYGDFVRKSSRTSSGLWKSTVFFSGLQGAIKSGARKASFDETDALVQEWLRREPKSPLARLAHAYLLESRAWSIRGGGYASTVKPENWQPFHEWLVRARDYMQEEKEIASTAPDYYVRMIDILRAQGQDPGLVFKEGVEKFPGYYEIYFSMVTYLMPKWHGDAAKLEEFASRSVASTRKIEGEAMYARIYWLAAQAGYDDRLFSDSKVHWSRMKAGFDAVVERYPDQWNLQNYGSFACRAGDLETLSKLFERIQEPSIDLVWDDRARYIRCGRLVGRFND